MADVRTFTRLCAQRSCRKLLPVCQAVVLPQTKYNFDLRFCWEHCDLPPESDLDDGQIRALLASPLYSQEREANADRSQVYHPLEKTQDQVHKFRRVRWNPSLCFQAKENRVQKHFSDREDSSLEHQRVQGNNEPLFRFSAPKEAIRSFLEEHKDYKLAEAKSEVRKQECRADFLDSSVRRLQKEPDSDRMEIYCTKKGCEESRKEQAGFHEE